MWVRRTIAAFFILLLFLSFAGVLFLAQLGDSLASPGFYNRQMEKADVYDFLYDDLLPTALDEAEETAADDNLVDTQAIRAEIIAAAREALPPDWLEQQFESITEAVIPYFTGRTDTFTHTIPLNERVSATTAAIKAHFIRGNAFASLYADLIAYAAETLIENLDRFPYALTLDQDQVESALRSAFPPDWMAAQLDAALDALLPYLTDQSDRFTITFRFEDRVDAVAAAALEILSTDETYDYVIDETIEPIVEENLPEGFSIPFGITFTADDITAAIKQVLPQTWVMARLADIIQEIAAYAKGRTPIFAVTVPLADRKAAAADVLAAIADQLLKETFESLPTCSQDQFSLALAKLVHKPFSTLPDCRPASISYETFKTMVGGAVGADVDAEIASRIHQTIAAEIPDEWTFSEEDLKEAVGSENEDLLERAQEYVSQGWGITESDLLDELDPKDEDTLNDVRRYIGEGYTFTEADLRETISDDGKDPEALDAFDDSRRLIHTLRSWSWAFWLLLAALLLGIGFLAGRDWKGRSLWAVGSLFFISLILCIAISVADAHLTDRKISAAFDASDLSGVERVITEKGEEIARNSASSIVSGIRGDTIATLVIAGVTGVGMIAWGFIERRRPPRAVAPTGHSPIPPAGPFPPDTDETITRPSDIEAPGGRNFNDG